MMLICANTCAAGCRLKRHKHPSDSRRALRALRQYNIARLPMNKERVTLQVARPLNVLFGDASVLVGFCLVAARSAATLFDVRLDRAGYCQALRPCKFLHSASQNADQATPRRTPQKAVGLRNAGRALSEAKRERFARFIGVSPRLSGGVRLGLANRQGFLFNYLNISELRITRVWGCSRGGVSLSCL